MLTININGIDAIDREEIAKHYGLSYGTAYRRLAASCINPIGFYHRNYYPLVAVLDYFDALPPVMPRGYHLRKKNILTEAK